ncbi:hypothetical protein HN419_04350 [Candidatus Woesearchaeota archaeon]|jgi:hypothetical protein|nr:hypothetical protein [Candidatus Woesearchaeota archaeon]MBT3537891.1 hypothetical protein [Candidatus Woesearchaeota archaeon]MBT4698022.1 hypothetical protein [Candidatus Woesearchaeota archaeon]MBT4716404.1 hypothetical protein [Candidatus Woesearchaeota archaeon]MBT7105560.1 hypothetical protein [Candidatus Woesearchaeota archaeon]
MKKTFLCVLAILIVSMMAVASMAQPSARDPKSYKVGYVVGHYDVSNNLLITPGVIHSPAKWQSIATKAGLPTFDKGSREYMYFVGRISTSDFRAGYTEGANDAKSMLSPKYVKADVNNGVALENEQTSYKRLSGELSPEVSVPHTRNLQSDLARSYLNTMMSSYALGYKVGMMDKATGMIRPYAYTLGNLPKMIAGKDFTETEIASINRPKFLLGYRHASMGRPAKYEAGAEYSSRKLSTASFVVGSTGVYDPYELQRVAKEKRDLRKVVYKPAAMKQKTVVEIVEEPVEEAMAEE